MKPTSVNWLIIPGLISTMLSGCATRMPSLPEPLPINATAHWDATEHPLLSSQFFSAQQDLGMQQYIVDVVNNNPDLKSIAATVKAARHSIGSVKADAWPQADLNLSGNRSKDVVSKEIGNTASVGINVSWAVDIWGKLSDDATAAHYLADKARYDLEQARRVLIAQAAHACIDYWAYVREEKNLIHLNTAYTNLRIFYEESFKEGLSPYAFYLDAKRQEQRSRTRLQDMQLKALKIQQYMNTLRGRMPADKLIIADDKIPLTLVSLTKDIPATAIADRPDIQAAFAEVLAFGSSARAAHKALLPQINLSGSALKSGTSLGKAFDAGLVWQLIGGLTQPLFNGGQLKAFAEQKSTEAEASWWQYQNTVLKALLEVESAIASDALLARQLKQKQILLHDMERKTHSTEERFSDGDLPLADYLQVKVEHIEEQIELSEIEIQYIKNRLALVMALGLPMETFREINNKKS